MNEEKNNQDIEVKMLLKKGIENIPTNDFTDRLMMQILSQKKLKTKTSLNLKLSWMLIGLTLILVPILIYFFSTNSGLFSNVSSETKISILTKSTS